jgi:hypothetical protein
MIWRISQRLVEARGSKEEVMRKLFVIAATAVAILATGSLAPKPAAAMSLGDPSGVRAAIDATNVVETVPCRLVRRCGPWGCGLRRVCWGGPVYYAPPVHVAPRPYWRGRYYRRHW